jgi:hypothetical protein
MRKIVFLLVLGMLVGSVGGVVEAATNSSSLPVPPPLVVPTTPTPTPTPVPVVLTPVATPVPTSVEMPVTASDNWTYVLIIGGIAACVFATYKLNLRKRKLN